MIEMAETQGSPTAAVAAESAAYSKLPSLVESFVSFLWMLWNEFAGKEGRLVL